MSDDDYFQDLYSKNAGRNMVAAGEGYGTYSSMRRRGFVTKPSSLETILMSTMRCYRMIIKIGIRRGDGGAQGFKLQGHTAIYPQTRPDDDDQDAPRSWGAASVATALGALQLVLSGPATDGAATRAADVYDQALAHAIFSGR